MQKCTSNTRSLRDNMAYITQQTYIFNETIEENIRLARRDATLDENYGSREEKRQFMISFWACQKVIKRNDGIGGNLSDGESNVSVLLVHSYTMHRLFYSMNRLVIWIA